MKLEVDTELLEDALKECLEKNPDSPPTLKIEGKELTYREILDELRKGSPRCQSIVQEILDASITLWET